MAQERNQAPDGVFWASEKDCLFEDGFLNTKLNYGRILRFDMTDGNLVREPSTPRL